MSEDKKNIRFYGRRQGKKIRNSRLVLIEELLPKIAVTIDSEGLINASDLFSFTPKEIWLEIGFGGGEHLAAQAEKNPDIGFIGSEVFVNGIASLLAHLSGSHEDGNGVYKKGALLEDGRVDNVRVFPQDVRKLFNRLPDAFFEKIFLLFPDPWPKKKHASRRFIGNENLQEISRLLKRGGTLRVASDDMNYIKWTLRHANIHPDFEWKAQNADDWRKSPKDWMPTRYEQKAISCGKKPIYLDYIKK